jgi:hypothetical protein
VLAAGFGVQAASVAVMSRFDLTSGSRTAHWLANALAYGCWALAVCLAAYGLRAEE